MSSVTSVMSVQPKVVKEKLNDQEKRMLISGSEEDVKVATALIAHKDILRECIYEYESKDFWIKQMRLDLVRELQTQHPELIITGSIGLFFSGVRLDRWKLPNYYPDIDIILPYYKSFKDKGELKFKYYEHKASGNDFDYTLQIQYQERSYNCDYKIANTREYEEVEYNGFIYKVATPEDIWMAKIQYAKKAGGLKHRNDLREAIGCRTFRELLNK